MDPLVRVREDDGAVAVTVAVTLIMLLLLAALVIDIGLARVDRQANQSAADLSATAGVLNLDRTQANAYRSVCESAWEYFLQNTPDADPSAPSRCAEYIDTLFACDPTVDSPAKSWTSGPYTFEIKIPVLDADPRMAGQSFNAEVDGPDPCDRVGISVTRDRQYIFAGIAGFGSASPVADAVARSAGAGDSGEFATLIILAQETCNALTTDGQGTIIVQNLEYTDPVTGEVKLFPGMITADSDGTASGGSQGCGNNRYVVDAGANGRICAGVEETRAIDILTNDSLPCDSMPQTLWTPASEAKDADPSDRAATPPRIEPEPLPGNRITRAPVEHRYNCRSDYYSAGAVQHPDPTDPERVAGCDTGNAPHVDNLVARFQTRTNAQMTAMGFRVVSGAACRNWKTISVSTATHTAAAGVFSGKWYFDCTGGNKLAVATGEIFAWTGGLGVGSSDNILVINGGISQTGTGRIRLNTQAVAVNPRCPTPCDPDLDAIVYFRSGDLETSGSGGVQIYGAFTYFHTGAIKSSADITDWIAPVGTAYDDDGNAVNCTAYTGLPVPSCFEDLAAWTNNAGEHSLGGQGVMNIDGIFFTPNAGRTGTTQFDLNGGTNQFLAHAQFFSYRLRVTGGGVIRMVPDPSRILEIPLTGGGLIR